MAYTGVTITADKYFNKYEHQYNLLKDNSKFFANTDEFDKAWQSVQSGNNKTFRSLDDYIKTLNYAAEQGIDNSHLEDIYDAEMFDAELKTTALYAEALADREMLKERERVITDEYGNPVTDEDGKIKTEQYKSTDYDYLKEMLDEQLKYKRQEWNNKLEEDLKNQRNFFAKAGADIVSVLGEFTTGITDTVESFLSFMNGVGQGIREFARTKDFTLARDAFVQGTVDPTLKIFSGLTDAVIEFERRYSDVRLFNGEYSTFGKYVGGVAHTLGMMVPSILVGKAAGGVGSKLASKTAQIGDTGLKVATAASTAGNIMMGVGTASSQLLFYEALTAQSVQEMYEQAARQGITVSSSQLLANACIKAALQWGVEVGLAKILGGSTLDNIVFGRKTATITSSNLAKAGAKRLLHDAFEEGLEETLQDTSDLFVNKVFDWILGSNFNKLQSITTYDMFDSFVMGAMASLAGSAARIVTSKNVAVAQYNEETDTYTEPAKLSKLASWEYGLNMQSVFNNYRTITEYAERAQKLGDKKALDRCEAALFELYVSARLISSVAGEIGQERATKANDILTYVTKAINDGQFSDVNYQEYADTIKNDILSTHITLPYKGEVKQAIKLRKKLEKLQKVKYAAKKDAPKDLTKPKTVLEKLDAIFKDNPTIEDIEVTEYGEDVSVQNNILIIPENLLSCTTDVINFAIADGAIIDSVIDAINKHQLLLTDNDIKKLKSIYKNYKGVDKVNMREFVASLCFDSAFIYEVLYHKDVNSCIFELINKLQKGIVKNTNAFDIAYTTKVKTITDNIKSIIREYIIQNGIAENYADYGLFTKEEYLQIEQARFEQNLYSKIRTNYKAVTDAEWSRLENLLQRVTTDGKILGVTPDALVDILKKGGAGKYELSSVLNTIMTKVGIKWRGDFDGKTYLANTSPANRAFNRFLMDKGLILQSLSNRESLTNDDVAFASSNNMSLDNPIDIFVAQFEIMNNNIYSVQTNGKDKIFAILTTSRYSGGHSVTKTSLSDKVTSKLSEVMKSSKDLQYQQRAFDTDVESEIVNELINDESNDIVKESATLDDLVKDASLLKESVINDIIAKYGQINEDTAFLYLSNYIINKYNNTFALGITNFGNAILCSNYKFDEYLKVSYDELVKMLNTKDVINFSEIFKDELLVGSLSKGKIILKNIRPNNGEFSTDADTGEARIVLDATYTRSSGVRAINNLQHEFQHAIQDFYKINPGANASLVISNENGKFSISKSVLNPEVVDRVILKLQNKYNLKELGAFDKNKHKWYSFLWSVIYYNSGELYSHGLYNTATSYELGLPMIWSDNRATNEIEIRILGETIRIKGQRSYRQLNSPIYSDAFSMLDLSTDYDTSLYNFVQGPLSLTEIDTDNIDTQDRYESAQALYRALGGSKQFASVADFKKIRLPIVYFEKPGTKIYDDYAIATVGNITKETLEQIINGQDGKLYVSYMSLGQLYYFVNNPINNVLVKKSQVFNDNNIMFSYHEQGVHKIMYEGTIIDENTTNVTFSENVEARVEQEDTIAEESEVTKPSENVVQENDETLAKKKEKSDKLIAELGDKVTRAEKKYGAKVVRAEREKAPKNKAYSSRITLYYDRSIKGGNVDYSFIYEYPEGYFKGKSISKKAEGPLKNFIGKNRSQSFKDFVIKSADIKLPAILQKKINDGTLSDRDVMDYVRSTPYDKIDDATFELINECYFKNSNIKTKEQLENLTEDTAKLWAAARLFFRLGKPEYLEKVYDTDIIQEITEILEEDPEYAEQLSEFQKEFTDIIVSNKYLRLLYMRKFDGTLVSAYRLAKLAKMAVEANWKTTGDVETVRSESEQTGRKDSRYDTNIAEETAYVSGDEEYFGADHLLYTTSEKEKIKTIVETWRKRAIVALKQGVKTIEDFGGDFGRAYTRQKGKVMEALFDDPGAFENAFKKASSLKRQIDQMYLRAIAAEITSNDAYLYDIGTVEKVIKYVDNSDRSARNIVQNIRHIAKNTIARNLSVAERKAFLKQNSDLFNDDMSLKEDALTYDDNGKRRYKDRSVLLEVEERIRKLSELAQSHSLSDAKQTKLRKQTERIISHQENEIQRLKAKTAKTRETIRTINVADVDITVNSNVPVPPSFFKLLATEFDKTAQGQVKFSDAETQEHVVVQVTKFLSENAEFLRNLSSSEANDIVDFFLNSSLVPTTNKFRTYLAVEICMITYILKDAKSASPQFNIDPEKIKKLDELFTTFQSIFGTGLSVIRQAVETIDPTKIVLKQLSRNLDVEIDDNDIDELTRAVKSGSYINMAEAQKKIYENLKQKYKGRKVNIFDRLLKFSRVAMLSSPGTWVRNISSNYIVSFFNALSEKVGPLVTNIIDKLFPKAAERRSDFAKSEKLYRDLQKIKISDEYKTFIDNDVVASGLLELIQDGLSKYNDEYLRGKSYSNILVKMIASGIRNKFMYNEEGGNKYLSAWYKFIYKRIADDKWVNKAFIRYLGKTLTYDKVDVSQGMTTEVMKHISDAYTLAAEDYMHKTNFINTVERALKSKIGPAGFFVYKSIFPFLSASMNWFLEGLKYTPFGLANAIIKYARLENTVDKMSHKNQQGEGVSYRFAEYLTSRDIGKGVIGTIGFAIGCMLAGFGIAGLDDKDDKIKLHIGDVYIDITGLFGTQGIMTGLSIVTAATKGNNASFMNVLKTTLDQMFMDSTISNMYNTVRYSTSAGDFLLSIPFNMASNFVPNIIGVASAANVYQNKYEKGIVGKLEKLLLKAMPTISYALPKTIDVYTGEKKIAYKLSPLVKFINKMGPVDFYPYKISALEKKALELGLSSNGLSGKFTVDNKTIKFGTKDTQYFNEMYGKLNNKHLTEFVNNKVKYKVLDKKTDKYVELTYSKMTDEQRKNVFERIMSKNENTVKIYAITSSGKYKYYTTYEEYQALKELGIRKNVYTKTDKSEGFVEIK